MFPDDPLKERCFSCLLAGAAGDALGYQVEFMKLDRIREIYGPDGVTEIEPVNGTRCISDDTQMTYLTLKCLSVSGNDPEPDTFQKDLFATYRVWARDQKRMEKAPADYPAFLRNVRSPGSTCMVNLSCFTGPSPLIDPRNDSKGCGGIMRVAPLGFLNLSLEKIAYLGILAASCTHGHPLGYLPAGVVACIVNILVHEPGTHVTDAVRKAVEAVGRMLSNEKYMKLFPEDIHEHWSELETLIDKAVRGALGNSDPVRDIGKLGEGWVAEETLAIAVYCSIRFENDIGSALRHAANMDGDSDSCAAVTGNILGCKTNESDIRSAINCENLESIPEFITFLNTWNIPSD